MGVDQRLVIRTIDRVVERGGVGPHLDAGYPGQGAIVHEGKSAAGLDPVTEPLFGAALLDIRTVRIADRDTDRTTVGSSLAQQVIQPRVRLVQEDGGVHQYVDVLAGLGQHVHEAVRLGMAAR